MKVLTILLIDENIKDALVIEKHLSRISELSYNFEHFLLLKDAEVYLSQNPASIILLAVNHSNINDLENVRRIRNVVPDLPIVVLLESVNNNFSNDSINAGADDYLVKNSLIHELTFRTLKYTIERNKAAEKEKESEKKYEELVNLLPQTVFELDIEGNITFANDSAFQAFGYKREELPYKFSALQIVEEKDRERALSNIKTVMSGHKTTGDEYSLLRKDGTTFPALIFSNPVARNGVIAGLRGIIIDITERKNTEKALYKSEDKYRKIFNSAPVGIYQSTRDGKILSANERLTQILGYDSKHELMQRNLGMDIYYHKHEREKYISEGDLRGSVSDLEICWKKKDGSPIWIQLTVNAIKDKSGTTLYYDGFVRDINEQKEAEAKLRENQKLLSTVIETIPVGIWLVDHNGTIIHGNSTAQKIWGGAKYVGIENYCEYKGWFTNSSKKIRSKEWGAARAFLSGEIIVNEEIEIESFDGKHKIILYSAVPILDSHKEITGAIVVNQEITELRLKDSQIKRLSRAVEQSPVSIVITDTNGDIEYVNPKFEQVTGYSFSESIGKNPRILKSGHTSKESYAEMWKVISSGNEWRGEFYNICKKGNYYWESAVISPIKNSAGVITNYLAVKEDISEQKKINSELIAAKERAEHSDHLKSEFLAQMSHEIRTPLNILLSFSAYIKEVLEERKQLTDDLDEYFFTASTAGKRIIRTIELILNMSDLKSGSFVNNPKPTDIYNDILKQIFHQFHQSIDERKIKFDLIQKSDSLFANIDPFAVEQLLIHLIDNAIKFTSKGHVLIYAKKNHTGNAVIKIEDTGVGISEEYLKRLFTPFTQEHQGYSRLFDGNGLGLALVKKYCELNDILINVQSEKNKGTTFTLTFPK